MQDSQGKDTVVCLDSMRKVRSLKKLSLQSQGKPDTQQGSEVVEVSSWDVALILAHARTLKHPVADALQRETWAQIQACKGLPSSFELSAITWNAIKDWNMLEARQCES